MDDKVPYKAMNNTHGPVLKRFELAATQFIACVDSAPDLDRNVFLAKVGRCLAELYCSALDIPTVEPESENPDDTSFPTEEWSQLYRSLREKIGELDVYWGVFDSTAKEEPVQATLSADISEIYYDLKQDLQLKTKRIAHADLIWEIHSSFREHWGRHAIDALKALYNLRL